MYVITLSDMSVKTPFRPATVFAALGLAALAFFSWIMFNIIWPYTSGRLDIDFLLTKQHIIHLLHYRIAFYLHIFPALLVLLAGLTQFSGTLLRNTPAIHRWIGRVYVFSILLVCGPAGMWMAWYANGGTFARLSFLVLSGLWWWTTWISYRAIRTGDIRKHGAWMIRSYALTLSAVTLRLMQFGLAMYSDIDPETAYRLVAWPSWVLNLAVAELILRNTAWFSRIYRK
ncbi:MAG: DUF2306 domain-containing protein [Bacteroidetes bacterium]|nr:MAG: DUF2306 domain-containing protein [Bacteroidota bacterium]